MEKLNPKRHGLIALGTLHRSRERGRYNRRCRNRRQRDRSRSFPRDKKSTTTTSANDGYSMPLGSDEDWSESLAICGGVEYSKTMPYIGLIRSFPRTYPFSHRLPYSDATEARAGSWSCGRFLDMGASPLAGAEKVAFFTRPTPARRDAPFTKRRSLVA